MKKYKSGDKLERYTLLEYNPISKNWKCLCECGNIKNVRPHNIKKGCVISCGCYNKEQTSLRMYKIHISNRLKDPTESNFNCLYRQYINNAKTRNISFLINKDDFKKITKLNCYYCNIPPSCNYRHHRTRKTLPYCYTGIDRIDNSKGYQLNNIVPCCTKCNNMKNSISIDMIIKLYNLIKEKNISAP